MGTSSMGWILQNFAATPHLEHSFLMIPKVNIPTVHIQILSLVLQRHQVLGFSRHCFKPAQTSSSLTFGFLRSSLSQEVVQVLGQIVGLWCRPGTVQSGGG